MKTYFNGFPNVTAFFSQRGDDGFSNSNYYSCNLGLNTGDDKSIVHKNRDAFLSYINFCEKDAAYADQRHTKNVAYVTHPSIYPECDALITNRKNIPLLIQVADCACVFLYDNQKNVAGIVHSGWRGSSKKIVTKTLQLLYKEFKSNMHDISAVISPCISERYFEVGSDVYVLFEPEYFEKKQNGKYLFDMKSFLKDELTDMGVSDIYVDDECTFDDTANYYSYRRDREKSGRMMGCIVLHDE